MQRVPPGQVDPTGMDVMGSVMGTLVRDTVFHRRRVFKKDAYT